MASHIHCKHWSLPFVDGERRHTCALGIDIRKLVGGPNFGWGTRMPCIHGHFYDAAKAVACDKREAYTREEVIAHEEKMIAAMNAFAEGRSPCCGAELIEQGTGRWCSKCKEFVARVCGDHEISGQDENEEAREVER